jgi:hypothetical protein
MQHLQVPNVHEKPGLSRPSSPSPSFVAHVASAPSPELGEYVSFVYVHPGFLMFDSEFDRHRQAIIEVASHHTVVLLLCVLASIYVAQHLTSTTSGLLLLSLAPSVILARVLRSRLERVSREDFDRRFAKVAHHLKGDSIFRPASPAPSFTSGDSGYETGVPQAQSTAAMHAFKPHRLSPILSVPSSQEADDGHSLRSIEGIRALSSVRTHSYEGDSSRPSTMYSEYPDSSIAGDHDPLRRVTVSPFPPDSPIAADEGGGISRRTTASAPGGWTGGHRLSTVPSSEELVFYNDDGDGLTASDSVRAVENGRSFRDSTYTTNTTYTNNTTSTVLSNRAVENASLGRYPSVSSSRATSMRATENGGVSRNTTASGASIAAVENAGIMPSTPSARVNRQSVASGQTFGTMVTDATDDTRRAVEDFQSLSRAPTNSSGKTTNTFASNKAVENLSKRNGSGASRAPSAGGSSISTHTSTRAVEDGGDGHPLRKSSISPSSTPGVSRGQTYSSFSAFSPSVLQDRDENEAEDPPSPWSSGMQSNVQSPASITSSVAAVEGGEREDERDGSRSPMERMSSDNTVDTVGSSGAVDDHEEEADSRGHTPVTPVTPAAHDYAHPNEDIPFLDGHAGEDDNDLDGGDLSSTESDESAESADTAGSRLRRRGGLRDPTGRRKDGRARAFSAATTHATTTETEGPALVGKVTRTTEWLKNHAPGLHHHQQQVSDGTTV